MSITYRIDIAFTSAPLATSPVWVDVTSYWLWDRGFEISRGGRPDEFSQPQPGHVNGLFLDNSTGAFTYGNPASPFSPNVVRDKRIRITAIVAGVEYTRYDGLVDDFKQTYQNGTTGASVVEVPSTDRTRLIAGRKTLRSFLGEEVLFDQPLLYVPLGDASTATTAENIAANPSGNGTPKNIGGGGTVTFGSGTGPPGDGASALVLTPASSTSGFYLEVPQPYTTLGVAYGLTLEAWVNSSQASTVLVSALSGSKASVLGLTIDASKHLVASTDAGTLTASSPTVAANGATRHCAVTVAADGTNHVLRLYLDGTQVASTSVANTALGFGCDRVRIGGDGYAGLYTGTVSHVAFHATALSATRITAHYTAGWTGFGGERSDQRVARIAAYVGLTSTVSGSRTGVGIFDDTVNGLFDSTLKFAGADVSLLEQGSAIVYGQSTGGQTAVAMFADVAETENGLIVSTRDGMLTMHSRSHRYNRAPRFSVSAGVIEQGLTWSIDPPYQANQYTAITQDGVSQTARNQASITSDSGVALADSKQLLTRDPLDAYSKASWTVNRYGTPRLRSPSIAIDLGTLPDDTATLILPADLGDSFLLTDTDPSWAPQVAAGFFIEDYSEQVGPGRHVITWATSNAALSQVGVFDDSRYGQFDTTLIFAF